MKNIIIFLTLITLGCDNGLKVKDWEHGKILCDANVIFINLGHEEDPEVKELLKLAKDCPK